MRNKYLVELTTEDVRQLIRDELATFRQEGLKLKREVVSKPEDELLTVKQTSKFLKLAESTIYSYVSLRKIPFIKLRGKLLFSKAQLTERLKERSYKTSKELKADAEEHILNKKGGCHVK